jgi:hypothetical protein
MAARLTTNTWTRAEWDAAQRGGTEGGFVADAIQRTSYDDYLKNAGFKSEAEAIAQRAKEDAEGVKFGEVKSADEIKQLAERKITPEYAAELDAAQARARAEDAKRIALLSKGYITGKEPVYIWGTPENKAFMEAANATAIATGQQPEVPDAYLDAQAFAARYELYNRYGATTPTVTTWDDAKKQYVTGPNPYYNAEVLTPKVGMGNQWAKLNNAKWSTVVPGVGSTAATENAQLAIESYFAKTAGGLPAGNRFFMRVPGDIVGGGGGGGTATATKTVLNTTKDANGNTITKYSDGSSTSTNSAGAVTQLTGSTSGNPLDTTLADEKKAQRVSAYNTLYDEFNKYGLGSLVSDIKNYLVDNTFDPSEFSIQLQNTAAYQKRFAANADRVKAGLSALRPAEYIAMEDQYQSLMRNYGLPDNYSAKGELGIQEGFNKLLANDVSATELEDRIATAQQRVVNADPNVLKTLKEFYPDITNGDILAYTLDPKNAIDMIKRKVTSAEIGGTQYGAGLNTSEAAAMALTKAGVTQGQYAQAAPFISEAAQRGSQLSDIYGQGTYNQQTAEAEALNLSGGAQAAAKRKKLTSLETAAFSGSSGVGALGRDKAIYGATYGQAGLV